MHQTRVHCPCLFDSEGKIQPGVQKGFDIFEPVFLCILVHKGVQGIFVQDEVMRLGQGGCCHGNQKCTCQNKQPSVLLPHWKGGVVW